MYNLSNIHNFPFKSFNDKDFEENELKGNLIIP